MSANDRNAHTGSGRAASPSALPLQAALGAAGVQQGSRRGLAQKRLEDLSAGEGSQSEALDSPTCVYPGRAMTMDKVLMAGTTEMLRAHLQLGELPFTLHTTLQVIPLEVIIVARPRLHQLQAALPHPTLRPSHPTSVTGSPHRKPPVLALSIRLRQCRSRGLMRRQTCPSPSLCHCLPRESRRRCLCRANQAGRISARLR